MVRTGAVTSNGSPFKAGRTLNLTTYYDIYVVDT